jgi:hypothetical protein
MDEDDLGGRCRIGSRADLRPPGRHVREHQCHEPTLKPFVHERDPTRDEPAAPTNPTGGRYPRGFRTCHVRTSRNGTSWVRSASECAPRIDQRFPKPRALVRFRREASAWLSEKLRISRTFLVSRVVPALRSRPLTTAWFWRRTGARKRSVPFLGGWAERSYLEQGVVVVGADGV